MPRLLWRKVSWGAALAVFASALLGVVTTSPASATNLFASAAAVSPAANRAYAQEILADINATRVSAGLAELETDSCAQQYADAYALTMDRDDLWQHSDLYSLLGDCGYRYAAENLAMVSNGTTPQHIVGLWMASPGHRANILSDKAAVSAIAVIWDSSRSAWIVVHNFGTAKPTKAAKTAVAKKAAVKAKAAKKKTAAKAKKKAAAKELARKKALAKKHHAKKHVAKKAARKK